MMNLILNQPLRNLDYAPGGAGRLALARRLRLAALHQHAGLVETHSDRPTGQVCAAQVEVRPHSAKLSLEFVFDRQSTCQF